jgi:hypothetical protein
VSILVLERFQVSIGAGAEGSADIGLPARASVCHRGKDAMRVRGSMYCEQLKGSGCRGEVEAWKADGQGHGFLLLWPMSEEVVAQDRAIAEFLNRR